MAEIKRFIAAGGLDNASKTIINVADPVNAQDAATKNFAINASNLTVGTLDSARLADSGVTAGTYAKVTVDAKGRVTVGAALAAGDIPDLSGTYQPADADLTAIAGLAGTAGLLRKTAANTWELDTNVYLTAHPTVAGASANIDNSGLTFIQDLKFDSFGHAIGSTSVAIQDASTSQKGVVQLSSATNSTSETTAATSAAVKAAYDLAAAAIPATEKGAANGVAALGSDGKVPASQLPSYVDDVLEFADLASFPATGVTEKIYVALDTNKIYRWSGSVYIEISPTAGNADTATKLATARNISLGGDLSGSASFDGSADITITATIQANSVALGTDTTGNYVATIAEGTSGAETGTSGLTIVAAAGEGTAATIALANSGVTAGDYTKVTVDARGRVTAGTNPTTLAGYGITDALSTAGNTLPLTNGALSSATLTTSTTGANQVIDAIATTAARTVKYLVQATSGSDYHSTEILVLHNGTTAYLTEYATIYSGASLATFDADVSGGNLRLLVTPVNAATTIKVVRTTVNV